MRFVVVFNDADEAVRAVTALRSLLKHIEHLDVGVLPPSSFDPNGASEVAHNLIVAAGGGLPQIKVDVGEAQRYVDIVVDRLVRYLRGEHSINGICAICLRPMFMKPYGANAGLWHRKWSACAAMHV